MLVRILGPGDGADVQAGLVGERRRTDVGRLRVGGRLRTSATWWLTAVSRSMRPSGRHGAELELQVGDDSGEVAVAGALAQAVQRALHVAGAGAHRGHRVGHRTARVVVAVDADDHVVADVAVNVGHDRLDLVRQRATIGVAQHDVRGAFHHGGLEGTQRELGVALEAVEEVLHVDEHPPALAGEERDRIGDHRLALVERRLQCVDTW